MRIFILLLLQLLAGLPLLAQSGINWSDISATQNLPAGVQLYEGERNSPLLKCWYLEVDMTEPDITIRPYIGAPKGLTDFTGSTGAYAAVNGGYFGGSTSLSAVVYPQEVHAQNIAALVRGGLTHPVTRSFLGLRSDKTLSVDWIYHFNNEVAGIYTFEHPAQNAPGVTAAVPDSSDGQRYDFLLAGIGGGPTLVRDGQVNVTYDEEVFFGSGVGLTNGDPRTAVGLTASNKTILFVADGRDGSWSDGVSLPELAEIMIELGCVEAMNLDGGGSSQMAVGNSLINRPEGGTFQRPVPTILAIVHADSLPEPPVIFYDDAIDTEDDNVNKIGTGWVPSANAGFYGGTPALLNSPGNGSRYIEFLPEISNSAIYEVQAWWVASGNRCTDTPIVIAHDNGRDTLRVDQTSGGATWNSLGSFSFDGNGEEYVRVSDAATDGSFVVADAIRIISYDSSSVTGINAAKNVPSAFRLMRSYPNPFNPQITIEFELPAAAVVNLQIYDNIGRRVATAYRGALSAGTHAWQWNATDAAGHPVSSGVYFVRLSVNQEVAVQKITLLK